MLTDEEARKLGSQVVKDTRNVRVKFGRTNGKATLHITMDGQSRTIYSVAEWSNHPWNESNKPRKRKPKDDDPIIDTAFERTPQHGILDPV